MTKMSPSSLLDRINAAASPKSPSGRIMKNVVVISVAFMIQFTAFQSMAALQSSINKVRREGHIGRNNLKCQ